MIVRSGIVVGLFTFLSRVLGFARDMLITNALGTSIEADCYNVAFRLPNFFRRIFAEGAFSSAFIPIFSQKMQGNPKDAKDFANKSFTVLFGVLFLTIIVLELLLPLLIYVLAPGFIKDNNHHAIGLASELCRISLPYLFFISLVSLFGGILNSYGKFSSFAASSIFLNITLIIFLVTNISHDEVHSLVWGIFAAGIIQLALIMISARNSNVSLKFSKVSTKDPDLGKLFKNMIPSIIGGGVMQINILVDQIIASFLHAGSISILIYADRVNQLPLALIGTAIGTVLLPNLAKQFAKDRDLAIFTQNRAIEIALLLAIPSAACLVIYGDIFCEILYQRGKFSAIDSFNTANALKIFALSLPGYVLVKILTPAFFANGDTKTPLRISCICLACNFFASLILSPFFSHLGIAMATAISAWVNASLLYVNLRKKSLIIIDQRLKKKFKSIIYSSITMGLVLVIYKHFFELNGLHCLISLAIASSCFLIIGYFNKSFDLDEISASLFKN